MTIETLDSLTMWLAFTYGAVLFFVLEMPWFKTVESRVPEMFLILRRHQPIALFCFWVGGLWIVQEFLVKM